MPTEPADPARIAGCLASWQALDQAKAIGPNDHLAIEGSVGGRAAVIERLQAGADHVDLLHAAAAVGRLMGQAGASPTLAALTVDHLHHASRGANRETSENRELDAKTDWIAPVRASLLEAFAVASLERVKLEAAQRWAFPRCAVPLDKSTIAIACGHPEDDVDALSSWADRTASAVARAGYREAYLAGGERASALLREALGVTGVTVVAPDSAAKSRR